MNPFIGMIVMFGGNFAPRGWALCDGALLSINQWQALFSILGTTYGGDGRTTFQLPDLRGRVPMHPGTGPGLTPRRLGDRGGIETVTLNILEIPAHNHLLNAAATASLNVVREDGNTTEPANASLANISPDTTNAYNSSATPDAAAKAGTITLGGATAANGGSQAHTNIQPFQCVNYIIAMEGTYPSRS